MTLQADQILESGDELLNRIFRFYTLQAMLQLYKLIGSLDLLGHPAAIFADVSGGVKHYFHERSSSSSELVQSIGKSIGLVAGGAGAITFGAAAGVTRWTSGAAAALSFDPKYQLRSQHTLQKEAASVRRGLYLGGQLVGSGLKSAIAGVYRQPIKAVREDGVRGLAKGVGKGTIGLVVKPASGLAAGVSKAAEGVAYASRRATSQQSSSSLTALRVRQPRELIALPGSGGRGVLLPYPRSAPLV